MFKIALKCYFGVGCVLFYNFGREILCFSTDQQSVLYSCVSDVIWGYKLKFYYVVQFFTQRGHYDTAGVYRRALTSFYITSITYTQPVSLYFFLVDFVHMYYIIACVTSQWNSSANGLNSKCIVLQSVDKTTLKLLYLELNRFCFVEFKISRSLWT